MQRQKHLKAQVNEQDLKLGSLYPSLKDILDISSKIAAKVWQISWAERNAAR